MSNSHVHPIFAGILEAFAAGRRTPVAAQSPDVDYSAAVAEETRKHDDVIDQSELAPITDDTLEEDRHYGGERDRLMDECGMRERDFF